MCFYLFFFLQWDGAFNTVAAVFIKRFNVDNGTCGDDDLLEHPIRVEVLLK